MQEHLIPQDISNYKFHLIGELDLKQFGEIMAGVIIAYLIFQSNWPDVIKWPLMIVCGGTGLFAAFIPIGGMPLSHWLSVFAGGLFAPTKFYWRKEPQIPSYFTYEMPKNTREFLNVSTTFNASPAKKRRALDYFTTLSGNSLTSSEDDPLEMFNDRALTAATSGFVAPVEEDKFVPATVQKMVIKPQVDNAQSVRQRQIVTPSQEAFDDFLKTNNIFQPSQITEQITSVDSEMNARAAAAQAALAPLGEPAAAGSGAPILGADSVPAAQPAAYQSTAQVTATTPDAIVSPIAVAPTTAPTGVTVPDLSATASAASPVQPPATMTSVGAISTPVPATLELPGTRTVAAAAPVVLEPLAPPVLDTKKRFEVSGVTIDSLNHPVADVIVNLQDINRNSIAILRSDASGNFAGGGLLAPGQYILSPQKQGLLFPEVLITADEFGVAPVLLTSQ